MYQIHCAAYLLEARIWKCLPQAVRGSRSKEKGGKPEGLNKYHIKKHKLLIYIPNLKELQSINFYRPRSSFSL
jgi:hypothetical protein